MLTPAFFREKFEAGLPYDRYVQAGRPDQQFNWNRQHGAVSLTPEQKQFLAGFRRRMNVLVTSGLWCGDCAAQVPILAHIARASRVIEVRIVDRDEHSDLSDQIRICGGLRVPTVVFLNEDYEFMAILGDQTLSRLRSRGARLGEGASCQLPGARQPGDLLVAMAADWVAEFERVQLLLRLSPKLRDRHRD
jgi:thiol-disulfide isomerase/thioredoxin